MTRLKHKWGIVNNFQFILILVTFALAGSSLIYLRPLLFRLFGIDPAWPFLLKAFLYLLIITPTHFVMLNIFAIPLGQSKFIWKFTVKLLSKMTPRFRRLHSGRT